VLGVAAVVQDTHILLIGGRDATGWLSDVVGLDVGGPDGIDAHYITVATQTSLADVRSLRAATAGASVDTQRMIAILSSLTTIELADLLLRTANLRQSLLGHARENSELASALRVEQGYKSAFHTGLNQVHIFIDIIMTC